MELQNNPLPKLLEATASTHPKDVTPMNIHDYHHASMSLLAKTHGLPQLLMRAKKAMPGLAKVMSGLTKVTSGLAEVISGVAEIIDAFKPSPAEGN